MPDVRKFFDKAYIYAYDLEGRDVTVTIERVVGGTLIGTGGTKSKKPVLYFKGTEKGLALNITNARTIAGLYGGFDSEQWIGKKITLYPTTTSFGSQTVDCIRVRNVIPKGKGEPIRPDVPPPAEADVMASAPLTASEINFGVAHD